jgi:hypothetical protein
MNTWKSIWAVVAGILVALILSVGTDFILEKLGIFPPIGTSVFGTWMLALAFFYRTIYGIIGAYITAALAPRRPMKHVMILGTLGLIVTVIGGIAMWDKGAHWYTLLLMITALPTAWLGGKLFTVKIHPARDIV